MTEREEELISNINLIRDHLNLYQGQRFTEGTWPAWLAFEARVSGQCCVDITFNSARFGTFVLTVSPIKWNALVHQFRIKFGQVCSLSMSMDATDLDRLKVMAEQMAIIYRHARFLIEKAGYEYVGNKERES